MLRTVFFSLLMVLTLCGISTTTNAHDSDVDLSNNVLTIEADDSHDVILVRVHAGDSTQLEVFVLQYDNPTNYFAFPSELDAIAAADDDEYEDYDIVDVHSIEIETYDGEDTILIDPALDIPCKIVTGLGADFIIAGNNDDEIWGDDENVVVGQRGNGGNDTIFAMDGHDIVHGGPAHDDIYGGGGNDDLFGDDGDDILEGADGLDDLFGDDGNDIMAGGSEADYMEGGPDNDFMDGGSGDDELHGDDGDDELFGDSGEDELFGGDDNDLLEGGYDGDVDFLEGGLGNDVFVYRYYEIQETTFSIQKRGMPSFLPSMPLISQVDVELDVMTDFIWRDDQLSGKSVD